MIPHIILQMSEWCTLRFMLNIQRWFMLISWISNHPIVGTNKIFKRMQLFSRLFLIHRILYNLIQSINPFLNILNPININFSYFNFLFPNLIRIRHRLIFTTSHSFPKIHPTIIILYSGTLRYISNSLTGFYFKFVIYLWIHCLHIL